MCFYWPVLIRTDRESLLKQSIGCDDPFLMILARSVDFFLFLVHIERSWKKVLNSGIVAHFWFCMSIAIFHMAIRLSFTTISLHFDQMRELRCKVLVIIVLIWTVDCLHSCRRIVFVDFFILCLKLLSLNVILLLNPFDLVIELRIQGLEVARDRLWFWPDRWFFLCWFQ